MSTLARARRALRRRIAAVNFFVVEFVIKVMAKTLWTEHRASTLLTMFLIAFSGNALAFR